MHVDKHAGRIVGSRRNERRLTLAACRDGMVVRPNSLRARAARVKSRSRRQLLKRCDTAGMAAICSGIFPIEFGGFRFLATHSITDRVDSKSFTIDRRMWQSAVRTQLVSGTLRYVSALGVCCKMRSA
jgi:hypothetical protein